MAIIIGSGSKVYGSADNDIVFGVGGVANQTISAAQGGRDVLVANHGPVIRDTTGTHTAFASALSIEDASYWATGNNALVGDDSIPYATIAGTGNGSSANWYAVTLAAGQTITLDVDAAMAGGTSTTRFDTALALYAPDRTPVASGLDSTPLVGGAGSYGDPLGTTSSSKDAYLTYQATTGGTYYVALGGQQSNALVATPTGSQFILNVSVSGHAATGSAAAVDGSTLTGGALADMLIGGGGGDTLSGGAGDDTLNGAGGNDTLDGGDGADSLDGGAGADTMSGGLGSDTYYVDNVSDVIKEHKGEGDKDIVYASVNYSLAGAYVEYMYLTGTDNINATGNSIYNFIQGNDGNNIIDGMGGADVMSGSQGDDTYYVDNVGDTVLEQRSNSQNGGDDTVYSSVSFTNRQYIEHIILTGSADINATSFQSALSLIGNSGANILDGGPGGQNMAGGTGNDTYMVDDVGDVVVENKTGGDHDAIISSVSYSLAGTYVETLTLTRGGTATGNSQANTLNGSGSADILDGKAGADTMAGGAGDDTYYVDNVGDKVIEGADAGNDTVYSTVGFSLAGQAVETLTLTGTDAINATGNSLANTLIGNGAANILKGGDGIDTLTGGGGIDHFRFDTTPGSGNIDTITDFTHGQDVIELSRSVYTAIASGRLADAAFYAGTTAHDASDRILYDASTGHLFYDPDGIGGAAAVQFATVTAGLTLSAHDFVGIL